MKNQNLDKAINTTMIICFLLYGLNSFSQEKENKFTAFEKQLKGNDAMIDFSSFVGAEGSERQRLNDLREECRKLYDASVYTNEGTSWYKDAFLSNFVFAFDRSFYEYKGGQRYYFDPKTRENILKNNTVGYKVDEIIDDGIKEFGGYDQIIIWVSYPRLGIDARNQFDLHADMPGGYGGLRKVVNQAHNRGVKVFIAYNPWDAETRYTNNTDAQGLAELAHEIGADGIFLDTMASTEESFTGPIEKLNPNIVYSTEAMPGKIELLEHLSGGWQQLTNAHNPGYYTNRVPPPTQFSKFRWIEPRYALRGDNRDAEILAPHIKYCFFHGYGFLVWENIFGWWNPMNVEDRNLLKKSVFILRQFKDAFHDMNWQPFIKTAVDDVYVNQWNDKDKTIYTVYNYSGHDINDMLLLVDNKEDMQCFDVWNGNEIQLEKHKNKAAIHYKIEKNGIGCIVLQPKGENPPEFYNAPSQLVETVYRKPPSISDMKYNVMTYNWQFKDKATTDGMVKIPGGIFAMNICHNVHPMMEGACYGDVSTRHAKNHATETFYLKPYYMDKNEVTNQEYKTFLDSSHFVPSDTTNFLKHWVKPSGTDNKPWLWTNPKHLDNHPVVWIDHDDANAYAQWYGKRLPTEAEWQYAAQGKEGYMWPWGNEFDENKCNGNSKGTMAVGSFPDGESPFGCNDMAGNVWEWTYKVWDDGHTRFSLLRGGSYFKTDGSMWYPASGAQPTEVHEKMLLLYPGMDRCANIGFRCAMKAPR